MDTRESRGLAIAATCRLTEKGGVWIVPSQSGKGRYTVCPHSYSPHCTCKDHEELGLKCKHIFAVEFVTKREKQSDGSEVVTSTVTIQEKVRKTYGQNWPLYNAAQSHEKEKFLSLLRDLCSGVQEPAQPRTGRRRIPRADGIFAACFKVYSGFSARRFMTDLRSAADEGYVDNAIHFNSVLNFLENPELTPVLKSMIVETSRALSAVETDFASDSSGFTTCRYERWYDHKYGMHKTRHEWVKVHLTCGVRTNIVTAVVIEDKNASDTKQLPELIRQTVQNFTIREMSADKAYGSLSNYAAIDEVGATPFIPFKSIHSGKGGGLWAKMFHYFNFKRDEFLSHYHKRSNVESTFSMIKRKFGDSLKSKSDAAMVNETLCKILCHNIVVLIHEMYELGIEPEFWGNEKPANSALKLA